MIFAGWSFTQLAMLFGAAAAVVVTLYVLKLRRRMVAVPFGPLWQRILRDKDATTLFSRLKRMLSMLLQLLLILLLVLALGDPRAQTALLKGRTLIVLVDTSASMQATDVKPTRLDQAKEEVKTLIRGMGGADRMLVAQMSSSTTPLGPMSGDSAELERELTELKATDTRADFARALRFATDTLRGQENAEIVVISDGGLAPPSDAAGAVHLGDVKLSYIPVGTGKRNVAVTEFSVRRYPLDRSRYEVMLEVTNTGPEPEEIELSLLGDGQVVDLSKLRLKPGERLPRFYPNLSGASRSLEARIRPLAGSVDDLPADDKAYALLPERKRAKVLVVTTGNTYLEAALLLDEYLEAQIVTPKQYVDGYAAKTQSYDVVIFDGVTPDAPPKAHALYLDPRGMGAPVKVGEAIASPGFEKIDRKHPIVRYTALDDVNIARGHKLVPEQGDKVIGASSEGAILVAGSRGPYKFAAMGFDVRESDLPLRVAWPVLLVNTVNFFIDEDVAYISAFRTGEVWRVPLGTDVRDVQVKEPDGTLTQVAVHEGKAVFQGTRAGFYELRAKRGGEDIVSQIAANLADTSESDIVAKPELVVDGKTAGRVQSVAVSVRRDVWIYLLVLAVLIAVLEWGTYHRRVTV